MSDDIQFAEGVYFKAPGDNAPDFVLGKISLKRQQVIDWLNTLDGEWVNLDVKESKGGKIYCSVDTWKPDSQKGGGSGGSRGGAPQRQRPQSSKPAPDSFEDDMDQIPFITDSAVW